VNKEDLTEGKTRILDAARVEFAAAGFDGASVQAIADRAQVSKGLIFHHFANKKSLFMQILQDSYDRLRGATMEVDTGQDMISLLTTATHNKLSFYIEHPHDYRLLMNTIENPPRPLRGELKGWRRDISSELGRVVCEKARSLPLKDDVLPQDVAAMIVSYVDYLQRRFMERAAKSDMADLPMIWKVEIEEQLTRYFSHITSGVCQWS